jgi:hypothetical protein
MILESNDIASSPFIVDIRMKMPLRRFYNVPQ